MKNDTLSRRRILQLLSISMVGATIIPTEVFGADPLMEEKKPVFIPAGSGKIEKIGAGDIAFKFNKLQTDGHLGITEGTLPVGLLGAPPHFHRAFDEICHVTRGVLTIMVGNELFEVKAGDWHLRPRGVVHTFWNTGSEPAKFIEVYSPGGHESYMSDLADLFKGNNRPKPGALDELAERHDINFDWPQLNVITEKYKVHL